MMTKMQMTTSSLTKHLVYFSVFHFIPMLTYVFLDVDDSVSEGESEHEVPQSEEEDAEEVNSRKKTKKKPAKTPDVMKTPAKKSLDQFKSPGLNSSPLSTPRTPNVSDGKELCED
jgi:hypothetical protein